MSAIVSVQLWVALLVALLVVAIIAAARCIVADDWIGCLGCCFVLALAAIAVLLARVWGWL